MNRRKFVCFGASAAALALSGCSSRNASGDESIANRRAQNKAWSYYESMYGSVTNEQFPISAVNLRNVKPRYFRRQVANETGHPAGTIYIDTRRYYLYWTLSDKTALRYGVGLGRAGFSWSGTGVIQWKQKWPKWTPPDEMILRQPELEEFSAENGGMPPGIKNPLGARALYIFQDGEDTLYRVHGSQEASSIGRAVSSGCVRLLNQDVIDLYDRVPTGSKIVVA